MKNKLPKFICVGTQKAGTTTLHDILSQDPQIYLPAIKETKFFQLDAKFKKGTEFYLEEFFNDAKKGQLIGEIDPDYMYFDYVPKRMYETLGKDIKLIFILRSPIRRALSHYQMSVRRGYETLSFEDAIAKEKERIKIDDSQEEFYKSKSHNASYIDRGYYSKQIQEFLKYFPKENMMFIVFEDDFIKNKEKTINNLYKFLNLEIPNTLKLDVKSNEKSIYKFKSITDFLHKPNAMKKGLKIFIPKRFRNRIIQVLDALNQRKLSMKEIPSREYLNDLQKKYYFDEIKLLEKLLERELDVWYK
jgi:Fe-S cluster biosynthesis and repair protein YggX